MEGTLCTVSRDLASDTPVIKIKRVIEREGKGESCMKNLKKGTNMIGYEKLYVVLP
jgi:hypothetical protein